MRTNYIIEGFSLFYLLVISFVYFNKRRIRNLANIFFIFLLIDNFFGLILEMLATYYISSDLQNLFMTQLINRLYIHQILMYIIFMSIYITYSLMERNNNTDKKFLIIHVVVLSIFIIGTILIGFLDIDVCQTVLFNDYAYYVEGAAPSFVSIIIVIVLVLLLIEIFMSKSKEKMYPSITWCLLFSTSIIVLLTRLLFPGITILYPVITLGNIIMFFIVQSPDVKKGNRLKTIRKEKQELDYSKNNFLSNMSREIRISLNTVVVLSNDILSADVPDEIKNDMNDVLAASNTLIDVIGNILDINKIEKDDNQLNNVTYDFKKEIGFCAKMNTVRIENKPINFIVNIDNSIPELLYGDKPKIKQIVNNLLSNAFKYTEKGNVILNIFCNTIGEECELSFEVKDSGIGIKDTSRLFQKFDRLDVDKTTNIEGTGLGLAITKNLVELLGGELKVESVYGEGSKFSFIIKQKVGKAIVEKNTVYNFHLLGKSFLIVDDNRFNLASSNRFFSKYNVKIDTCSSGSEAINMVKTKDYDLILLDTIMPEMDGIVTFRKINAIKPEIPVIALTADVVDGSKEKYLAAGFNGFIGKPLIKNEVDRELNKIFKE